MPYRRSRHGGRPHGASFTAHIGAIKVFLFACARHGTGSDRRMSGGEVNRAHGSYQCGYSLAGALAVRFAGSGAGRSPVIHGNRRVALWICTQTDARGGCRLWDCSRVCRSAEGESNHVPLLCMFEPPVFVSVVSFRSIVFSYC